MAPRRDGTPGGDSVDPFWGKGRSDAEDKIRLMNMALGLLTDKQYASENEDGFDLGDFLVDLLVPGAAIADTFGQFIMPSYRHLAGDEMALAQSVFGGSLPDFSNIILTDLSGPDNRGFTVPGSF